MVPLEAVAEENTLVMGAEETLLQGMRRPLEEGETLPFSEGRHLLQSPLPPPPPPGTLTGSKTLPSGSVLTSLSGSVLKGPHFGRMN